MITFTKQIQNILPNIPKIGVILGSGLSQFTDNLTDIITIPYSDIEGYPQPTVSGHVGEFVFGYIGETPVICARGRFHFYEGHSLDIVTLPIHVFSELGCNTVIITNAAGCVEKSWEVGDLMIIDGFLDYTFRNGPQDPNIINGDNYFNPEAIKIAEKVGTYFNLNLRKGVYTWASGPSYETPAEIIDIRQLGGHAVGMSTVPEIIESRKLGLNCLGISCLTNYASGVTNQPLSHTEVLETTEKVKDEFTRLVTGIIERL
jgi:purine-nucleoside phosphorylase